MRKRTFALALTVALVVGLLPLGAAPAAAYTVSEAFPVSLANQGQVQPDIDYPWIVWKDNRDCNNDEQSDIYAYNFATGEEMQVTTMRDPESNPSVSGDWVVYSHYDYNDTSYCSVYATNLVTGEERLIADGVGESTYYGNPAIDGDTVVYKQNDGYNDVFIYDLATETTELITDDTNTLYENAPEIGDGWVVWAGQWYDGANWQYSIFAYELATGTETEIMPGFYTSGTDYMQFFDPSTDGGYVACYGSGRWTGDGDTDYGEFLYDLAEIETAGYEAVRIDGAAGYGRRSKPSIGDGVVTWHDDRTDDGHSWFFDVYMYDIASDTETCLLAATDLDTADEIYGGRTAVGDGIVAWQDHRDEGVNDDGTDECDLYAMFLDSVPPVAADDAYTTSQNVPLSVAAPGVLANDSDADGDALSGVAKYSDPAHGSVAVNANGSFVYVPDTAFTGTDTFQYEVSDGTYYSVGTVTVTVTPSTELNEETGAVWRFYNPVSGSHFYTPSLEERNYVISHYLGVWVYEGYAFTALPAPGTVGIHRFYNAGAGAHFYTPSDTEQATVLAKWPTVFTYEGRSFPVTLAPGANTLTVHRFYNTKTGAHFYTASEAEKASVIAKYPGLFIYEGVGFYTVTSL